MSRAYPSHPIVGVGVVVLRPDAVLLVRRGNPPDQGRWSLPGGAQEIGETVEAAARRELQEETGLTVGGLLLASYVDSIHRDPSGAVIYHYTILDFATVWRGDLPQPASDVSDIAWGRFTDLDDYDLWHEAHRVIKIARELLLPREVDHVPV